MNERIGVEQARGELGRLVDLARYRGERTVLTKNGVPCAMVVPYDEAQETEASQQDTAAEVKP